MIGRATMRVALSTVLALSILPFPAGAMSKAAAYLVRERIGMVCPSGGSFAKGVTERDLTGDGKADLILDLGGLRCRGAANGLNDECGAAHCPVLFYVRDGDLLRFVSEVASVGATVGRGNRPAITLVDFDYKEHTVRWNGKDFD